LVVCGLGVGGRCRRTAAEEEEEEEEESLFKADAVISDEKPES